jgi:PhnB protein
MAKAKPVPEGCEGIIPHLVVRDGAAAIDFYKRAFGAEEVARMPSPDGRILHAHLRIGGTAVFLADDFPEMCGGQPRNPQALRGTPVTIHRYVTDTDAAIKRAQEAGATVKSPPADMFWGDRFGVIEDPFGHEWSIATHTKDLTPEEISKAAKSFASSTKPSGGSPIR